MNWSARSLKANTESRKSGKPPPRWKPPGPQVDKRCGLHVHFDARSMKLKAVKNLFKLWLKFEDVLDTFQPPSRRGNTNTYCRTNLEGGVSDSGDHRDQCFRMFERSTPARAWTR